MDKNKRHAFPEESVNWAELEALGVYKEDLERSGQMDALLDGQSTEPVALNLMLSGISLELDATLQLVVQDQTVTVEIKGVTPGQPAC